MIKKSDFEKYIRATNNKKSFLIEDCDKSGLDRQVFVNIAVDFDKYLELYKNNELKN